MNVISWFKSYTFSKLNWDYGAYFKLEDYVRIIVNLKAVFDIAQQRGREVGAFPDLETEFLLTVTDSNPDFPTARYFYKGVHYKSDPINTLENTVCKLCTALGIGYTVKTWAADERFLQPDDLNRIENAIVSAFNCVMQLAYGQQQLAFTLGTPFPVAFGQGYRDYSICYSTLLHPNATDYVRNGTMEIFIEWEVYATNYLLDRDDIKLIITATGYPSFEIHSDVITITEITGGFHCSYLWTVPDDFYSSSFDPDHNAIYFNFFPLNGLVQNYYSIKFLDAEEFDWENWLHSVQPGTVTTEDYVTINVTVPDRNRCKYVHAILPDGSVYAFAESGITSHRATVPLQMGEQTIVIEYAYMSGHIYKPLLYVTREEA